MALIEVVANLRANADDMVSGFRRAQGAANGFNQSVGAAGGTARVAFGTIARFATIGATAMQGAAVAGATMGVKFAMANEQAIISFKTLLGSQEAAQSMFKSLQTFAASTPFEFPQLRDAASKLLTTGVAADRVLPIMTALGDSTAAMGTGAEGIQRAVYALQQMNLVGKITGQDMMQLANAGIPAWDALASAAGMSVQEVKKAVEKGTLQNSVQLLMTGIEKYSGAAMGRVKGMMEEQSKTLTGLMSTLKDNVNIALGDMMKPAVGAIKDALPAINDAIGKTFKSMTEPVNKMVTQVMEAFTKLIPAIEPMMMALSTIMVAAITAILPAIAQMASVLPSLQPALEGIASVIQDVAAVVAPLVVELVTNFVPIISTMVAVIANATHFLVEHKGILEALTPVIGAVVAGYVAFKVANAAVGWVKMVADLGKLVAATVAHATASGARATAAAAAAAAEQALAVAQAEALAALYAGIPAEAALATAQTAQATAATAAAAAQTGLNTAMYANPIGLIIAAIAALVVAFVIMWKKFEWFRRFWKMTWNVIVEGVQFAINRVLSWLNNLINGVINVVNLIIKAWNLVPWHKDVEEIKQINLQLDITGAKVDSNAEKAKNMANQFKKATDYARALNDLNTSYEKAQQRADYRKSHGPKTPTTPTATTPKAVSSKISSLINAAKSIGQDALNAAQQTLQSLQDKAANFYDSIHSAIMGVYSFSNAMGASLQSQKDYEDAVKAVASAQEAVNEAIKNRDWDAYVKASNDLVTATDNMNTAQQGQKTFMQALEEQYKKAKDFAVLINRLRAGGLNEAGIAQIIAAGADTGSAIANELLAGGTDAIGKANVWYDELTSTANAAASAAKDQFYKQGLSQGEQLVKGIQDAVEKLDMGLAAKGITAKTIQSLVSEFKTQVGNLNSAANVSTGAGTLTPLASAPSMTTPDWSAIDLSGINFGFLDFSGLGTLMADGGIVKATRGGTLARIGEAGQDEAVIPLGRSGLFDNAGNNYNITIHTGVGDKTAIAEEIVSALQQYERRYGSVPVRTR